MASAVPFFHVFEFRRAKGDSIKTIRTCSVRIV
jgi:hypothetical protein